jgi:hypothetical protein
MLLACAAVVLPQERGRDGSSEKWITVETFKYRAGVPGSIQRTFILESPKEPDMEQSFTRLRVQSPGQPEFVLINEYAWWIKLKRIPNWFSQRKNVISSEYVFGMPTSMRGVPHTLLFLVGWPFGSSPGSLHILDLEGARPPVVVLKKEELEFAGLQDLNNDGMSEIIGAPCMSQEWGDHLLTYDPIHVFTLRQPGPVAELSIPLSRTYNEQHYYGWVGPQCSEEWAVVLHPPGGGKPIIMKAAEAEKIGRKSPKK